MGLLDRWLHRRTGDTTSSDATAGLSREERFRFLGRIPPFSSLPRTVVELVSGSLRPRHYRAGEVLMRQEEPGSELVVLVDGRVEVRVRTSSGERVLARVGGGEVVGEMALLTHEPRTADVVALTDVRALSLAASEFERLVGRHPELGVVLTHLLADRLGQDVIDGLGEKSLGGYRIERRLGRGGMAVVYEATRESDGERVALKMMSHSLVFNPEAMERFQREAEIVQGLEHPGIAAVLDRFAAYKTFFIAMEYCDGASLRDVIRHHGPLPENTVRRILGQLVVALRYIHEQRVIHRDLKPSNVMLDRSGAVKLMDFGIARPNAIETRLTPTGVIVGTPAYMAPEQLAAHGVDERSDLYPLGLIGLEMLEGMPLFGEGDLASLMYRKLTWTLPSRAEIRNDLSQELYDVLRRLLEKKPEDRTFDADRVASWAAPADGALVAGLPEESGIGDDSANETRTEPGGS